jgi:hypothetical protein
MLANRFTIEELHNEWFPHLSTATLKGAVAVQQAQSPSLVNSGDGGSEVYLIVQSEQVHAGFGGAEQMRNWAIDSDWKRNERSRGREKKGRGLDDLQLNSATRSI